MPVQAHATCGKVWVISMHRGQQRRQVRDRLPYWHRLLAQPPSLTTSMTCSTWEVDYQSWQERCLDDRELVYAWADGRIYVKADLEKVKACLLVVIGAMSDGLPAAGRPERGLGPDVRIPRIHRSPGWRFSKTYGTAACNIPS